MSAFWKGFLAGVASMVVLGFVLYVGMGFYFIGV